MDKEILIGLIIGLLTATTIYVYKSNKFKKWQKTILYLCIVFAPAQWLLILVFLTINHTVDENSNKRKEEKEVEKIISKNLDKLQTLKDLHEQGILTDNEYYEKSAKLKSEQLQNKLKTTPEYKKLKELYDNGILSKEEFDNKVSKIKIFFDEGLSEKGKERIRELVNEKIRFQDYKEILKHYNKSNKVNKALRDRLEKLFRINTNLSDKELIDYVIEYSREKFNK